MSVSVIIPSYNRAHTLSRAIDSVLEQTLPADEILIVDDGSTDDTHDLITQKYPQCRYLQQPNLGVSAARNLGIQSAHSDWIALLDSDDAWLPGKLAIQITELEQQPDIRICHTDEIWIRNGRRVNQMNKHAKYGGSIFKRCLPLCVISPSSVLLKRELFDDYGWFDTNLPACEDYDLWLRLCATETVLFIEQPLIEKYGGHADQLSHMHWGMDRFRVEALQKIIGSNRLHGDNLVAAAQTLVDKCAILANGAIKRGQTERADHYRHLALRHRHLLPQ